MAGGIPNTSNLWRGGVRLPVVGGLVCLALFVAHVHLAAALCTLLVVALAGALRRSQEHARLHVLDDKAVASGRGGGKPAALGTVVDRRGLEATLDAEWQRDHRPGEPTALLLIGIDAFESLEEHGGLLARDVAMLTLASALARSLPREADLLARYNERTFAVVLRGTDLPGSLRVAARLRWAIVRLGITNAKTASGFLTACIGLAVQHGQSDSGTAQLLAAAEKSLQTAQQVGHDSLEYVVAGTESRHVPDRDQAATHSVALPAIRAWSPEGAQGLHSPQS